MPGQPADDMGEKPSLRRHPLLPEGNSKRLRASLILVVLSAIAALAVARMTAPAKLGSLQIDNAQAALPIANTLSKVNDAVEESSHAACIVEAEAHLEEAVSAFTDAGYELGYVVAELDGSWESSHEEKLRCYSASSIKGPYLIALFQYLERRGDPLSDELRRKATEILVWSDNESYSSLRKQSDGEIFRAWLIEVGVDEDVANHLATYWYGPISARDLACMWSAARNYLEGDSEGAHYLCELLSQPETSSIRKLAGNETQTWSKAGWCPNQGEFGSSPTTCEGGIVHTGNGGYVLAVVSNAPEDFELMDNLVRSLAELRDAAQY